MKNDLEDRHDIKGIIQRLIKRNFGIKRLIYYMNFEAYATLITFNAVCTHISPRDLIQEHFVFNIWPLRAEWVMPELKKDSSFWSRS
jgi:diadenosine tetraphosphate (Ap4A) HIT family hydrolase